MKIVFLNGPPRCGKDTAGNILQGSAGYRVAKFAAILKERTHALYGKHLPHAAFESSKDQPQGFFLGATPRQAYIAVSERLMKPLHGEDVFGRLLLEHIRPMAVLRLTGVAITDSGFAAEAAPIVAWAGAAQCRLIRIHREGCTFNGDSRGYIELPGVPTVEVVNPGTRAEFAKLLLEAVA